ncbi:hypothetical protein [Blastomonas aquatica]|uniref:Uncharacterized protein n=1 Tax=Blastomonas aquatica TaxID=1510276 RepID=A0ABQ1J8I8_9SPHN|nr:hypothetical protein [Blastomonas aquatica]GGB62425.1 hypothetical protein GCM10010833_16750 [Blastomonas aquatica]
MTHDQKARLLHQIGATLKADRRFSPLGTLFICAVEDMFISMSLFWDRGNYIAYHSPDYDKFEDDMIALWELDPPDQRWLEIQYVLRGKESEVNVLYEADLGDDLVDPKRLRDSTQRYFGTKRVVYPTWRDGPTAGL